MSTHSVSMRTVAPPLADTAGVAAHEASCVPPHRRPVCRLDQGFVTGLQARAPKRRHGCRHDQASLAPMHLPVEEAAAADGSCRRQSHPPRVARRMQAGVDSKAAMAVVGTSMALPKFGQQRRRCSEGGKLRVTSLPPRTLKIMLSTEL
ncbi:hypothetical protein HPB50_017605 [Hyalomma asiaticum]|uniref:Uncharacterized protein n=1 Tax=Hyalomma asiaticum TaxID=266040 RepID=A0ACB7TM49_HYAAI|nr:hypothetical protein HPB50_017605 [Hyalomma asiaticum]